MTNYKVKKLLDTCRGMSKRTGLEWKSRDVVLEAEQNCTYPDTVVASLRGDMIDKFTAGEGDTVGVELGFRAHEYEGRWFNSIDIRNFELNPAF